MTSNKPIIENKETKTKTKTKLILFWGSLASAVLFLIGKVGFNELFSRGTLEVILIFFDIFKIELLLLFIIYFTYEIVIKILGDGLRSIFIIEFDNKKKFSFS